MEFLDKKQQEKLLMLIKNSGKDQQEVAKILDVTPQHLSGALPLNPRMKEEDKKARKINVPAKWLKDFEKELELERLRALEKKVNDLTSDGK